MTPETAIPRPLAAAMAVVLALALAPPAHAASDPPPPAGAAPARPDPGDTSTDGSSLRHGAPSGEEAAGASLHGPTHTITGNRNCSPSGTPARGAGSSGGTMAPSCATGMTGTTAMPEDDGR